MKTAIRIIITILAFIATYFFVFWVPFSLIPGARGIASLPVIVSLLVASTVGIFLWKKTGKMPNSLPSYIFTGGIMVGAVGFVLGFFGPMILYPEANQGPLLGLFFTGPLGFLLGLLGGGLFWLVKGKSK